MRHPYQTVHCLKSRRYRLSPTHKVAHEKDIPLSIHHRLSIKSQMAQRYSNLREQTYRLAMLEDAGDNVDRLSSIGSRLVDHGLSLSYMIFLIEYSSRPDKAKKILEKRITERFVEDRTLYTSNDPHIT